jgi:hypothetical protein
MTKNQTNLTINEKFKCRKNESVFLLKPLPSKKDPGLKKINNSEKRNNQLTTMLKSDNDTNSKLSIKLPPIAVPRFVAPTLIPKKTCLSKKQIKVLTSAGQLEASAHGDIF